jgi:hypothetical protein
MVIYGNGVRITGIPTSTALPLTDGHGKVEVM